MKLSENSLLELIKQVIREEEDDKKKSSGDKSAPPEDKETDFQDLPIPFPDDPFKKDVDESKIKLKNLVKESFWNQAAQMKGWEAPPKERRWSKSMNDGLGHLTEFEANKGGKDFRDKKGLKEYNRNYTELEKYETAIFDVIIQFKKIYERSEHKKNRKINKYIQELLKIEAKLGDEVTELE